MFRWCAYCQHLIGEAEPLSSYEITHGICRGCEARLAEPPAGIAPGALKAQSHFNNLMKAGRSGDPSVIEELIQLAMKDGLRSSDILVGIIQPALYRIGQLWQKGEVTVADEHRFTEFCLMVYERLPQAPPPSGRASILLALAPDNRHDLGVQILKYLAVEKGVPCRVLPAGTSASEIVAAVIEARPALFGLSISMSSSLEEASGLLALCAKAAPGMHMAIGGLLVRERSEDFLPGVKIARRVDDFMAELEALAPSRPPKI